MIIDTDIVAIPHIILTFVYVVWPYSASCLHLHPQAEKKVYELELVNREKNYNQVFNARPQVGVLDPLQIKVC